MPLRRLIVPLLLVAALANLTVPGDRAFADAPTCPDPQSGETYGATAFLTSSGTLIGTTGRDVLVGSTEDDVIRGYGGDDLICSNGGNDIIDGGTGNDVIDATYEDISGLAVVHGGAGDDWMDVFGDAYGDAGNDFLIGGDGTFWGGTGNDTLDLNSGVAMYGGAGNDWLHAIGVPIADGGSDNDYLFGEYDDTALFGGSGNDTLEIYDENPVKSMDGGSGKDSCAPFGVPTRSCERLS